jgi:hypothetical protein
LTGQTLPQAPQLACMYTRGAINTLRIASHIVALVNVSKSVLLHPW